MPINRYRLYGQEDDQPNVAGDVQFVGVDYYSDKTNIEPGFVQSAVNADFSTSYVGTRGGFVCLPELGNAPFGMTWTSRTAASSRTWTSVVYGNGQFVAVASSGVGNRVMTSPDGITWTSQTSAADYNWNDIAWSGSLYAACASSGTTDRIMTSSNGTSWSLATTPNKSLQGICYGNGKFVAVGTGGVIYSTDGVTWTAGTISVSTQWRSVAYGNGYYVAVSSLGDAAVSTDGINFTLTSSSALAPGSLDVTFGNGIFIALVGTGAIYTSIDGTTWTAQTPANDNIWTTITYGAGTFVAVANSGSGNYYVMTSRNGIGWVNRTAASNSAWRGVTYGNGTFVAVGANLVMTTNVNDQTVFACGEYSPPADPGAKYIALVGRSSVGFYSFGQTSRSVSLGSYTVTEQACIVQCNNYVYLFRGDTSVPLYWDGNWSGSFTAVPEPTPAAGFQTIPYSNQATYYQNRLWVRQGKDYVAASDVLDFTTYDLLSNDFNLNTGSSDYVVATFPFGQDGLVAFKNKSILLIQNVTGSLADVTVTEITRQVGIIGINAVTSIGPDLAYVSDRNINLLTLTNTNNSVQHKTLPLSVKIRDIMGRVNWAYGYKISMAFWDNKLFVALPLDNSTVCNTVVVYSFINEAWFGEWNFAAEMNMSILGFATANYLGLQRLHAISEDGRIFVVSEGWQDISGTVFADIPFTVKTRAYNLTNTEQVQRRAYVDLATLRPTFSVEVFAPGVSESTEILTDETYSRSESWLAEPATYSLTNSGDNYNTAYRKDYSATCSESVQPQSGFYPEVDQVVRLPLMCGRNGRYFWAQVSNTTGRLTLQGAGFETRDGSRSNLIQV
jgi:hypothetical protein